jgi:hypothetical protein
MAHMRNSIIRIVIWASAGFIVAVGWGLYFTYANKAEPIGPIIYTLSRLTVPLVAMVASYGVPIGIRTTIVANAATYALIGLLLGAIWRYARPAQVPH